MIPRVAFALAALLAVVSLAAAAEERAPQPVEWVAPEELKPLFEKFLPPPPAQANEERGAMRRWVREVRRRAPEIAAAEGWFSAKVDVETGGAEPRVVLTPGERTTVAAVDITFRGDLAGEGAFREQRRAKLRAEWRLPAGAVFRQEAWDEAKTRLLEALTADDYAAGEFVSTEARIDADAARATLTLVLDSGPAFTLGEVQVTGLSRYRPELVRRMLDIDPGEPYRTSRLLDLQRSLQSTPWFANVTVDLERDAAHPVRVPVRVGITERPAADAGVSAGFGTDAGARGELSLRYRNLFDRGYDMISAVQADATRQVGYVDVYLPPGTVGLPRIIPLGGFEVKDSVGLLAENTSNQGLNTRRFAVAGYRQYFYQKAELRLGLSYQSETKLPEGGRESLNRALAPVAELTLRLVDSPLDPTRGGVLTLKLAGGAKGFGSDQNFLRTYAQYQHWFPVTPADQVILRAEAGFTKAPSRDGIPEDYLFRAGGSRSVRGYEYQSLGVQDGDAIVGGRYLATGTAEYVHWFTREWGGAAFLDVGDAADAYDDLTANKGYGLGVRWRTPAGPLAFDVAYADRDHKVRVVFSVSVAF